jgi:hypothetical protein
MTIAKDNTERAAKMTSMTDDNDNMIKLGEDGPEDDFPDHYIPERKDEWEETPGGFSKLQLDLDEDVLAGLVDVWARKNLCEASLEQYEEVKAADGQIAAIHSAVVNEIIIEALTEQIARATGKDAT